MSMGLILLFVLILLVFLGMPVAFAIGVASMCCVLYGGYPITIMAQKLVSGLDSFVLLAIPYWKTATTDTSRRQSRVMPRYSGRSFLPASSLSYTATPRGWI